VDKLFWGRVKFEQSSSYYKLNKGGKVQELIHQLKYRGQKEVGEYIGKVFGSELKSLGWKPDLIVPVPLHPKKLRKRGYNQSECFADGISTSMNIPVITNALVRLNFTETQTKLDRDKRWENVRYAFRIQNAPEFENKHILLVDDVVTTGATIEACAEVLLQIPGVKVSVATIAYADLF